MYKWIIIFDFIFYKNSEIKLGLYKTPNKVYIIIGKVLEYQICSQYIVNTYRPYSIQFFIGTEAHTII